MSPPPPPKRASHIQMQTTRVEDKEFAACKAAIKIYLQQNKDRSRPQSIDYPGQYHRLTALAGPGYRASVPVCHITDGYHYFFKCWRLRLWPVVCVLQTYCFGPHSAFGPMGY